MANKDKDYANYLQTRRWSGFVYRYLFVYPFFLKYLGKNNYDYGCGVGDFLKFANHTTVYMVAADVTTSSNAATVKIEPPLISSLADDEGVTYDSVPFTVYLTNDIQEFGAVGSDNSGNLLYEFELDVEEAL